MSDSYPVLEAYREKLLAQWYSDCLTKEERQFCYVALGNAHRYSLDIHDVLAVTEINWHRCMEREKERDTPLWIEVSEPFKSPSVSNRECSQWDWARKGDEVSAFFYYCPAREYARYDISFPVRGRYDLYMISCKGMASDIYSYYTSEERLAIPCFCKCPACTHQEHTLQASQMQESCVTPCKRCDQLLSAWRNRFCKALTLIQALEEHINTSASDISL